MENWLWYVLTGLGASYLGWLLATWVPVLRRKDGSLSDPELVELVLSLQRSVKLIQGRLNALAPPREGTGRGTVSSLPETRQEMLARLTRGTGA